LEITGPAQGPLVLLVEDEPKIIDVMARILHKGGYRTAFAVTADDGLEGARRLQPALITIDIQRDFLDDGPMPIPGSRAVLPAMARLLALYRDKGWPIVHIVRLYRPDGQNVDLCRRAWVEGGARAAAPGSEGSQLPVDLLPDPAIRLDHERLLAGGVQGIGPREVIIYKPRFGAFFQTPLETHLRDQGVDTVVFCGCNYPNCPRASIFDASERDFRVVLATDALSGLYPQGEAEMAGIGVAIMTTDQVERAARAA
jgi:nicotinamidase-related amidase